MNLNLLRQNLLVDLTDVQIVSEVNKMTQNFTSRRERIEDYTFDKKMVSAYASFYLPTNFPKLQFLMNQLSKEILDSLVNSNFFDIGCGPGTFSLAFAEFIKDRFESEINPTIIGIDQSKLMVKQAQKLTRALYPDFNFLFDKDLKDIPEGPKTLFFGHSLNEMGLGGLKKWVEKLNPETVLFIEPGTKEFFKQALEIRDYFKERGYFCYYPCPNLNNPCPFSEDDWCHQVLKMNHDPEIERLSQMAKIDRRSQPMIMHAYGKTNFKPNLKLTSGMGRLLRQISENKHSFNWEVCLEENSGSAPEALRIEIPKGKMKKKDQKLLKKTNVGTKVRFKVIKEISPDLIRVSLKD